MIKLRRGEGNGKTDCIDNSASQRSIDAADAEETDRQAETQQ